MLARLRHHAVVGGDHQQEHVDPGRAGDHRAHEPLVPRHVHDRQPPARRQLERRVAELDRDPARLLLRQPVGVDAGQRGDQRRLAVVDVAGGAERQRLICRHWSSVRVRQSSSTRPSRTTRHHRWVGRPQRGRQRVAAVQGAGEARELEQRHGAAAHPGRARDHLAAKAAGQPLRALPDRVGRLGGGRQHGDVAQGALGVAVELERRLERGQRELVDAHRARQRMAADALEHGRLPHDHARLRPAEQLVAREAHHRGTGLDRAARGGLVGQIGQVEQLAGAEIVDQRQAVPGGQRRQIRQGGGGREPDDAEVRLVDAEDRRGVGADGALVVAHATCGWCCRSRPAARRTGPGCRGCESRRRSRSARRG